MKMKTTLLIGSILLLARVTFGQYIQEFPTSSGGPSVFVPAASLSSGGTAAALASTGAGSVIATAKMMERSGNASLVISDIATGGTNNGTVFVSGSLPGYVSITLVGLYDVFGGGAGNTTMSGDYNTAFGDNCFYQDTTGIYNAAFGYAALAANSSGSYNAAIGLDALQANTTADYNTAAGFTALPYDTTGHHNVGVGAATFYNLTTGSYDTAVGVTAGYNGSSPLLTLSNCTFIGYNATSSTDGITNSTAIGNGAVVNQSNQVAIGNAAVTQVFAGTLPVALISGSGSVSLSANGLAPGASISAAIPTPGAALYDLPVIGPPPNPPAGIVWTAYVSASGTTTLTLSALATVSGTAQTWRVKDIRQ